MTSVIIDMASRGFVEAPLRVSESLEVIDLIISQFISYNNREKYTGLLLLVQHYGDTPHGVPRGP